MLKGEIKDRKGNKVISLIVFMLSVLFLMLFELFLVSASGDVAYIYRRESRVDDNIVDVFNDMGLSVDLIDEKDLESVDFDNYQIIFVGDERFRHQEDIPIGEHPSIIANYYFGYEWGLTDPDGVSKLAANSPLKVKLVDNSIRQVYTRAKYLTKSISIPYYYLDDENKVPESESVARTYIGNDNSDFGDVISYIYAGTPLIGNGITENKVCFFGIVESDYWTSHARDMFEDCIGFVGISCESDNDCPSQNIGQAYCSDGAIYQDMEIFECINPGTVQSECVDDIISELVEDCGEDSCNEWEDNFCQDEDVWKNRTCYDRGCSGGSCFENENIEQELVEDCDDDFETCSNGQCTNLPIECHTNIDCDDSNQYTYDTCINPGTPQSYCEYEPIACLNGDCGENGYIGEPFCNDSSVYQNYQIFECINPGTPEAECSDHIEKRLIQECSEACLDGECVGCIDDNDCEDDYYIDNYCEDNNVYKDFINYSCENNTCVFETIQQLVDDCEPDEICFNGSCEKITCSLNSDCGENGFLGWRYCQNNNAYEDFISFTCFFPGTLNSFCFNYTLPILLDYCEGDCISGQCIECFNNLGCGEDDYIGEPYCQDEDVWQDYEEFLCSNSGTPESNCSSDIFPKLVENCSDTCIDGQCIEIECFNNSDCDDMDSLTYDECLNPGTPMSECRNTPINCGDDNDCGITGFIGGEYCFLGMVYKDYKTSICVNNGTLDSYCNISINSQFINDCGEDSCDNWTDSYCIGNESWHNRTCYDRGCENGSCFSRLYEDSEFIEECEHGCIDGECLPECQVDGDCDDGLWCNGPETCVNNECVPGIAIDCDDGIDCTIDSCNEQEDRCDNTPDDSLCNDGLFCNGVETCDILTGCEPGTPIDCSSFNILGIATCDNNPDNNPLTWDFRQEVISMCDESSDSCTTGNDNITHTCNTSCGAECIIDEDCPDKCTTKSHKLYEFIGCEDCVCEYGGYSCVIGECGAECDSNDDCTCPEDKCNGTTLLDYPDYGECGTAGSEGCLCQNGTGQGEECQATLVPFAPECYLPECGNGINDSGEECDDGNMNDNDNCKNDCTLNICGDGVLYDGVEECDDGNNINGDGCDENCNIEIIICSNDSDCGIEGWKDDYYCGGVGDEDVYRNYENYTCLNPGTPSSSCDSEVEDILIGDCFLGCSNGTCLGCI